MNKDDLNIDLMETWKEMSKQKFENRNLEKQEIMNAIKSDSNHTIIELKKNLKKKLLWFPICIGMWIYFCNLHYSEPIHFWFYAILMILYTIGFIFILRYYLKMDNGLKEDNTVLATLKRNRKAIKTAIKIERIVGVLSILVFYVFVFSQMAFEATSFKNLVIKISLVLLFTMVIIYGAERMNKFTFGNKIKEIEENIIRLEMIS